MKVTVEVFWYYEEQEKDGRWTSAYAGYLYARETATALMEKRKAQVPRARLRLVKVKKETRSYRSRNLP